MWAAVAALTGVGEREEEGTGKRGQAVSGSVLGQGSGGSCRAGALRAARDWRGVLGRRGWAQAEEKKGAELSQRGEKASGPKNEEGSGEEEISFFFL